MCILGKLYKDYFHFNNSWLKIIMVLNLKLTQEPKNAMRPRESKTPIRAAWVRVKQKDCEPLTFLRHVFIKYV